MLESLHFLWAITVHSFYFTHALWHRLLFVIHREFSSRWTQQLALLLHSTASPGTIRDRLLTELEPHNIVMEVNNDHYYSSQDAGYVGYARDTTLV
jgi:hypothetical protein